MPKFFHAMAGFALIATMLTPGHSGATGKHQAGERKMTKIANRLVRITAETRTVCVGRFLIDVPANSEVVYGPARVPLYLSRFAGEAKNLDVEVRRALAAIEEHRDFARGGLRSEHSMLGTVLKGIGSNHKIVFGLGRGSFSFYSVQSLISIGEDLFSQFYDVSGDGDEYLEAVAELKAVASLLRSRAANEIPAEPGICLDGAFLSEPQHYMLEAVSLGIRLKEFSDVHMSIQMTKKDIFIESDALEPRMKRAEQMAKSSGMAKWYSRIKILRRGYRRWGDWEGFEVLARKPAQQFEGENHEFAYQSHGEPKNPLMPELEIELHSGVSENRTGAIKPSISDEEAVYLWDTIIGSIRPRPTRAPAHPSAPAGTERRPSLP
jgi:hypothetical protein